MRDTYTSARPGTLLLVAVSALLLGGGLGAMTNAVNASVSPEYFTTIMGWQHVQGVWRASIAQGILEGLIYAAVFSTLFTLVLGIASAARADFGFAARHLLLAGFIVLIAWALGGVTAMLLATLSPEWYRNRFFGVPNDFSRMLAYAWVGGSIWGAIIGAVLSVVIVPTSAAVNWRRQHP